MASIRENLDDYHRTRREAVERLNRLQLGTSKGGSKGKACRAAVFLCAAAAVLGSIAGLYFGLADSKGRLAIPAWIAERIGF